MYKTDANGDRTDEWTTPNIKDVNGARPALAQFLGLHQNLQVVITMGD